MDALQVRSPGQAGNAAVGVAETAGAVAQAHGWNDARSLDEIPSEIVARRPPDWRNWGAPENWSENKLSFWRSCQPLSTISAKEETHRGNPWLDSAGHRHLARPAVHHAKGRLSHLRGGHRVLVEHRGQGDHDRQEGVA